MMVARTRVLPAVLIIAVAACSTGGGRDTYEISANTVIGEGLRSVDRPLTTETDDYYAGAFEWVLATELAGELERATNVQKFQAGSLRHAGRDCPDYRNIETRTYRMIMSTSMTYVVGCDPVRDQGEPPPPPDVPLNVLIAAVGEMGLTCGRPANGVATCQTEIESVRTRRYARDVQREYNVPSELVDHFYHTIRATLREGGRAEFSIEATHLTTVFRPISAAEIEGLEAANWLRFRQNRFAARLLNQPIFIVFTNELDARRVAREAAAHDENGRRAYVTRFKVRPEVLERYEMRTVEADAGARHLVPENRIDWFNPDIVGPIEVIAEYDGSEGGS